MRLQKNLLNMPEKVEVVSFDVFDTVLTRNIYHPHDLFLRVQARLADLSRENDVFSAGSFPAARISAEAEARDCLAGREDISLDDILRVLVSRSGCSGEMIADLARFEIEEEIRSAVPVASVISLLEKLRQAGKKIVFLSDMYLPAEVVEKMLGQVGALSPQDKVYVSGSVGRKKSTGSLFQYVLEDLQIKPDQMIHLGDYLLSDFLVPRLKKGVRSFPVRLARNNIYERLWGDSCHCLYCRSIAGASRAARLAMPVKELNAEQRALYTLGGNVLAPMITGFALATLREAQRTGVRRLYFLSRDGEVVLEIARELAGRLGVDIELRYLNVSRNAVFPALLGTGVEPDTTNWLWEPNITLTIEILADRVKVDADFLFRALKRAGLELEAVDAPLDRSHIESIGCLLVEDSVLKQHLAKVGMQSLQNLAGYLEGEQLFDGTSSGLVDLGWHGSIQDVIHTCFSDRLGPDGLSGFYFGVDSRGAEKCRKWGYLFDYRDDPQVNRFREIFRVMMELLCSGTHGMVRAYERESDGCYHPIFNEVESRTNQDRVRFLRRGCRTFLDCLDSFGLDSASLQDMDSRHVRPQILGVLKKLFLFPSREEALALGCFCFSADQAGHGVHQVAPPFTLSSTIRYLLNRSYAGRSKVSSWFFASWTSAKGGSRLMLFPLVWILRLNYMRMQSVTFMILRVADFVNRWIDETLGVNKKNIDSDRS